MNYGRRGVGIVVCSGPVALMVASLAVGPCRFLGDPRSIGLAVLGLLVGLCNVYLSIGRPWLYRRRRGSMEGYRHVSGIPLVGSLLVVAAGVVGFGLGVTAVIGLLALALDPGGLPWFLVATWRDESFWDA